MRACSLLLLALPLTACVSQIRYDEAQHRIQDLETALSQMERDAQQRTAELEARIAALNEQLSLLGSDHNANADQIAALYAERDALMNQLAMANQQYQEALNRPPVVQVVPEVDTDLRAFAEAHADLVDYDPHQGLIKFRSDLTFALGSAELSPQALETFSQLATILTNPAADIYEVRIVGHTDSLNIKRAQTKAKHPTNWHLSVHRALAVRQALEEAGFPAHRTSVAGHSKYRPIVANRPGGAEPNRRVEIFLLRMGNVQAEYFKEN